MHETWYVLADGTLGDPNEIGHGVDGVLRHKDGRAVAYGPHGPRSRGGVDAAAERAKAKRKNGAENKEMRPSSTPKFGYDTREFETK